MSNAIKDVLSAEREADAIIAQAQRDHEVEVLTAKQKALQLVEQGKARVDAALDAKLQDLRRNLDAERARIAAAAQAQAAVLSQRAMAKIPQLAELLLRKFEAQVYHAEH